MREEQIYCEKTLQMSLSSNLNKLVSSSASNANPMIFI